MRRPWPALVLFLGGAFLLVALYLPWQRVSVDFHEFGVDPSYLVFGAEPFDGWASTVAPAAALAALLLVGLSAVAFARPALTRRLPLGRFALVAAYFGLAVAVDTRSQGEFGVTGTEEALRFAYGAYLGIGGATAMVLAALALRGRELRQLRSPFHLAAAILALALLLVLLLPWAQFMEFQYRGIPTAPAQVAAVVAICTPSAPRTLALLAGLFSAAAFSAFATSDLELRYGVWLVLGLAICFGVLSLSGGFRRPDLQRVPWTPLVLSAAGLLLMTSFFLPWQEFCYPADTFEPMPGLCVSPSAWGSEAASGAALLAIALIIGELGRLRRLPSRTESAAGIALLVTTLGFQHGQGAEYHLRYGFWIGAACTAVIVVLAAVRVRPPPLDARLAPIALCLVYLAVVVPPWWGLFESDQPRFFWFAPFSWLTVAGALLALMLMRLWFGRFADVRLLLVIPAVIAALAGLDLARAETVTWGGGIVLALCGLLGLCAFVEQQGGLGELRIPEILRVDRL